MTPAEVVAAARKAGHIVIVYKGETFFNTWAEAEALKWEEKGAFLVPHYSDEELQHYRKRGRHTKQGWEVHLLGACERVEIEDAGGELFDITKDTLLAAARDRVAV